MKINKQRMWERLMRLSDYGSTAGHPEKGITRESFSSEYGHGVDQLTQYMKEAGMSVRIDAVGNIFARYEGREKGLPCIMAGSHFDTVPGGGRFDGLTGIAAALEAVQCIHDAGIVPKYPIEVAAFVNEEACRFKGGLMGSKAMAGMLHEEHIHNTFDVEGNSLYDAMKQFGADPDHIEDAVRKRGEIEAFYEVHIEQAAHLEKQGIPVGIVTNVAGIHQMLIKIHGQADHAGGTPMKERKDALLAAAQITQAVNRIAVHNSRTARGTVGYIKVIPGVHNIIASDVEMSVDFREVRSDVRIRMFSEFKEAVKNICCDNRVNYEIKVTLDMPPVAADIRIMEAYKASAEAANVPYTYIVSYAAHDTMIMDRLCPTGMLFLRCRGGLSHCPEESVSAEDMEAAANVLLGIILSTSENG